MNKDINLTDGTVTEVLNNKVDIDFGNIPSNSVGFARCSTEVTNCITEIPQRIKLELKDGILTLKAGSQVIVPNGFEEDGVTFKFDYVNIEEDLSISKWGTDVTSICTLGLRKDGEILKFTTMAPTTLFSGSTKPTPNVGEWWEWYDTVNNKINYTSNNGTSYDSDYCSFPFALIQTRNSVFISIDQVFNGMGYIGSTVWVDKGVKCLIPNGRNEDGTLKNIEFIRHKLETETTATTNKNMIGVIDDASNVWDGHQFIESETQPADNMTYTFWYQPSTNILKWHTTETSGWKRTRAAVFARYIRTSGVISDFKPKYTFQTLDYNNKAQIGAWGLPSTRYIDLTLGASTSTYVAPANGYFYINKMTSAGGQYLTVGNNNTGVVMVVDKQGIGSWCTILMSALKGQSCYVTYTAGGKVNNFRFYYSEGEV